MPTSLPQHDPDPQARAEARRVARDTYRYTWHRPEAVATAAEVPRSDAFRVGVLLEYGRVQAKLKAHNLLVTTAHRAEQIAAQHEASEAEGQGLDARVAGAVKLVRRGPEHRATPEVALAWFGAEVPSLIARMTAEPERHDELFAWQRLGGANPYALRRLRAIPAGVALDQATFATAAAALGLGAVVAGGQDDLERALASGRLFAADWRYLAGARDGGEAVGLTKRLYPAIALFVQESGGARRFLPLAIQCADGPLLTPADGTAWTMAKLVAQCADTHEQALTHHVARCHFVMDAITVALARAFAPEHPIRRLLTPHTQYTLAIDASVRDTLMKPGEDLEVLLAATLGQSLWLVADAMKAFDLTASLPPHDVKARGLDDVATLPHCPLRDDGLPLWEILRRFVADYVALYYEGDGDVAADPEARAFGRELSDRWGGRLGGVPALETRDALVDVVTFAIWTAGPLHSICNDSQLEFMASSANMPVALFGDAPRRDATPDDLEALYAPEELSIAQYAFFYGQTQLRENALGVYPPDAFDDPRVAPLLAGLRAALDAADAAVEARNATRPAPYVWLSSRTMRASIHS